MNYSAHRLESNVTLDVYPQHPPVPKKTKLTEVSKLLSVHTMWTHQYNMCNSLISKECNLMMGSIDSIQLVKAIDRKTICSNEIEVGGVTHTTIQINCELF